MITDRILPVLLCLIAFNSTACAQTDSANAHTLAPIFYLYDIANQTQEDITTILGPQSSLNAEDAANAICANCQKYSYQNDRIIIEYTNDMADRITIRSRAGIKAEAVPALLGLKFSAPNGSSKDKVQWTRYPGIKEINAFVGQDEKVRLVLVKVLTL